MAVQSLTYILKSAIFGLACTVFLLVCLGRMEQARLAGVALVVVALPELVELLTGDGLPQRRNRR